MENPFLKSIWLDSYEIGPVLGHQQALLTSRNLVFMMRNEGDLIELKPKGVDKWIPHTKNGLGSLW